MYNPTLFKLAKWRLDGANNTKQAFIPPGASDPMAAGGAGGMPPMDPSMMGGGGGMPPMDPSMMGGGGGMPPMDPSMMGGGGMPPMDPSMMGGAPPPPAAPSPDISETIRSVIQQELANAGVGGGGGGKGGAGGGRGGAGTARPDIVTVANDIFQVKKLITYVMNMFQIPMPPDILDGPNRDPATGLPVAPGTPGSTSDPSQQQMPAAPPNNSSIKPIEPMQGAAPPPPGAEKQSSLFDLGINDDPAPLFTNIKNRAAFMAKLAKSLREQKELANAN